MANCCICGKRIGGWGEDKLEFDKQHILCYQCAPLYRKADDATDQEQSQIALQKLTEKICSCNTSSDVVDLINQKLSTRQERAVQKMQAETCCICGNNIEGFGVDKYEIDKQHVLCYKCAPMYRKAIDMTNQKQAQVAVQQLAEKMFASKASNEVISFINQKLVNQNEYANEIIHEELERKIALEEALKQYEKNKKDFLITTGYNFEKHEIIKYLDLVHGEIVMHTDYLTGFEATVGVFFESHSKHQARQISFAKEQAQKQMIINALSLGANALIGVSFIITTFADDKVGISATGTAVYIEKLS